MIQGVNCMNKEVTQQEFNNVGQFEVTIDDLPLSCPMPNMSLWDAHPRVYLPIEEAGEVTCPYCSAFYKLKREVS
jgi:uncharacterized Zn-finger protein